MTALIASIAGVLSSILAIVLIFLNRKNKRQEKLEKLAEDATVKLKEANEQQDKSKLLDAWDDINRAGGLR